MRLPAENGYFNWSKLNILAVIVIRLHNKHGVVTQDIWHFCLLFSGLYILLGRP